MLSVTESDPGLSPGRDSDENVVIIKKVFNYKICKFALNQIASFRFCLEYNIPIYPYYNLSVL